MLNYSLPCSCSSNLSSFWLILKQQWTIKISSPYFLFLAWRPSWLEVGITGHKFGREPSKDHSTKVWLQLALWFLMRLKCEMLTDGRRTKSDGTKSVFSLSSLFSISGTHRIVMERHLNHLSHHVTLVKNLVMSHERGREDWIVTMTNGTFSRGHLWYKHSVTVNHIMMTVKLSK